MYSRIKVESLPLKNISTGHFCTDFFILIQFRDYYTLSKLFLNAPQRKLTVESVSVFFTLFRPSTSELTD